MKKKNRNSFLEILKNNLNPQLVVLLIKTQEGSKYCENKIELDSDYANKILYPCVKPYMLQLINDFFGNFLYQKFVDVLEEKNFDDFLGFISANFRDIAFSPNGTRVIQKLIESMDLKTKKGENIYQVISYHLNKNVKEMAIDSNSSHILARFLLHVKYPKNNFVYEEVYKSFLNIASTKYGCCIIQKCILHSNTIQKNALNELILKNTFQLISNQFGNYVYQCFILTSDEALLTLAYRVLSKDIFSLCKEKYSSNVIEKLFDFKDKIIVNEIANSILETDSKIIDLLLNEYGNYVIQKAFYSITDERLKDKIVSIIRKKHEKIYKLSFGRKLVLKIMNQYPVFNF